MSQSFYISLDIFTFSVENDYSPSLREIAENIHKSIGSVQHYLEQLEIKGYLSRENGIARSIQSVAKNTVQIFKLGYIAAGNPIEPIENPELIDVPNSMVKEPGTYYALQVRGTSMIEDHIEDGDLILIKHQNHANDGDRVVAITEDGATLKVFRQKNGKMYLEPRNNNLTPYYPKRLEIRGKFCGLLRNITQG